MIMFSSLFATLCLVAGTLSVSAMPRPAGQLAPSNTITSEVDLSSVQPSAAASAADLGPIASGTKRYLAYWSIWADSGMTPTEEQLGGVTHVVLAFMNASETGSPKWADTNDVPFSKQTVADIRGVDRQRKVMVALGGWNNDFFFRPRTSSGARSAFIDDIVKFIDDHELDGIDIDWEFPVNNGESYKWPESNPLARPEDKEDAQNLVDFLKELRARIPDKLISIAVPARHDDQIAYGMPGIAAGVDASVDWWNLMTYDFVNRRDNITQHHAGGSVIEDSLLVYADGFGIDKSKVNVGYPLYAKWFEMSAPCEAAPPIGCSMDGPFEGPIGEDTGKSGIAVWNPSTAGIKSLSSTELDAHHDDTAMASAWYDTAQSLFWTWVSPKDISASCEKYVGEVGGVFVWSLNQDNQGPAGGPHLKAIETCVSKA